MKRIVLAHKEKNLSIFNLLKSFIKHIAPISMLFISIGFINLWFYLKTIEQLPLLPSAISSPSALFSIFASMSIVITACLFIIILPAVFFFMLYLINKNNLRDKEIIINGTIISFILVVLGSINDGNIILGLITFLASFYFCYFIYIFYHNNIVIFLKILLQGAVINIPILITLLTINSNIVSSYQTIPIRLLILLIYAMISYIPIFTLNYIINQRNIYSRQSIKAISLGLLFIFYFIIAATPGIFTKLNYNIITYSGFNNNTKQLYKVLKENYPTGWIEENFDNSILEKNFIWVEGYAIFQNNAIALICPEKTYKNVQKYIMENITRFNNSRNSNLSDTTKCILIENKPYYKAAIKNSSNE